MPEKHCRAKYELRPHGPDCWIVVQRGGWLGDDQFLLVSTDNAGKRHTDWARYDTSQFTSAAAALSWLELAIWQSAWRQLKELRYEKGCAARKDTSIRIPPWPKL